MLTQVDDISKRFGDKVVENIKEKIDHAVEMSSEDFNYLYTHADLDKVLEQEGCDEGDEETLREYIIDTEETFDLQHSDVNTMTIEQLNEYVKYLDSLWE